MSHGRHYAAPPTVHDWAWWVLVAVTSLIVVAGVVLVALIPTTQ
jgi:Ni/Fe-hydrogenase subunit HybB-like protein